MAGSFATGVAALGHGLADGVAPSVLAVVSGLIFAGLLGTLLAGRRPSLPRLAVTVGGAQLAFHVVFSWLTPGTSTAGDHHSAGVLLAPASAHHGTDPAMWAAHALAAVATLAFLVRAERALWNLLVDALEAVTVARTPAIAARPRVGRAVPGAESRHPLVPDFLSAFSLRGPPARLGA